MSRSGSDHRDTIIERIAREATWQATTVLLGQKLDSLIHFNKSGGDSNDKPTAVQSRSMAMLGNSIDKDRIA